MWTLELSDNTYIYTDTVPNKITGIREAQLNLARNQSITLITLISPSGKKYTYTPEELNSI